MLDGSDVTETLKNRFLSKEFVYIPYLGKNDHFANITDVEVVDLQKIQDCKRVHSMLLTKYVEKAEESDEDDDEPFKYQERLPIALDKEDNLYELEKFVFTNMDVVLNNFEQIYSCTNRNIAFF